MSKDNPAPLAQRLHVALALVVPSSKATRCPDDEEIAQLVDAPHTHGYADFISHIGQCERCYLIWRDARAASLGVILPGDTAEFALGSRLVLSALAVLATEPSGVCLNTEMIAAYVDHALGEVERQRVMVHLADCSRCYEVWLDAVSVLSDKPVKTNSAVEFNTIQSAESSVVKTGAMKGVSVVPAQHGWLGDLSHWLKDTFGAKSGTFGGGLATAAVLIVAVLVALPHKADLQPNLASLYGDVTPYGEAALLGLSAPPATSVSRSADLSRDPERAFRAGVRDAFTRIVLRPNAQWTASLKAMEDVLPECMFEGKLQSCSASVLASYAAGQWMALAYTGCAAGAAESLAPALSNKLDQIMAALALTQTVAPFVDDLRELANKRIEPGQVCSMARDWIK